MKYKDKTTLAFIGTLVALTVFFLIVDDWTSFFSGVLLAIMFSRYSIMAQHQE